MINYYCPICGNEFEEAYGHGDICPCCGNESGFDDMILAMVIRLDKDIKKNIYKDLWEKKFNLDDYEYVPKIYAWEIRRCIWIKNGGNWKLNEYGEKPNNWSLETAKKQLLNIDVNLDDILHKLPR